jgi:hypothetical protein
MPIAPRTRSAKLLVGGLVALPLVVVGCSPASRDAGDSANSQTDAVVTENASDKVAFDYFVSKGLTGVQAAGIVGNLDQESGMSPTIAQLGGGPGRGIAQWSVGERWNGSPKDNVAWYAAQQGASEYSLQLQLDFIWYELTTLGYGYSELRAATTVTEATDAFMKYYEICGNCVASSRIAHAEAALADFGGSAPNPPSPPPPAPPPPTTGGNCTAGGVSGTCITTSTCQAMGYVSTAGLCPGAADIECCTAPSSGSSGGTGGSGSGSSGGSGGSGGSGAGGSGSGSSGGTGGSASGPSCSANGTDGTCIDTGACAAMTGYTSTPGFCAGAANIECCTPPPSCMASGVSGTCIDAGVCAANGGTSTPGLCPGSASEECCTM